MEEGSTTGVEILYLFMIWFWKVIEVEQEKSEPGPNSIRLSKDKRFHFLLPQTQASHSSGKVDGSGVAQNKIKRMEQPLKNGCYPSNGVG